MGFYVKVKSRFSKEARIKLKQLFAICFLGLTLQVQAASFIRLGELNVKPEQLATTQQVIKENIRTSIQTEPELSAMYAMPQTDDAHKIYVLEVYQNAEAKQAHNQSEHFKRFAQATEQAFASKTPLKAQLISENKTALQLDGNYLVRLQALTAKPNQTEAIRHALAKYRTTNESLLAVYASTVENQDEQWRIVEIYASPASYEQHHQSQAYKNYRNELKPLLVSQDINSILDGKFLMNKGGMQF